MSDDNSSKKKKSMIPKIFSTKKSNCGNSNNEITTLEENAAISQELERIAARRKAFMEASPEIRKSLSEREPSRDIQGLNLSNLDQSVARATEIKEIRMVVATWNVGGKTPDDSLNLEDFLKSEGCADLYVCGFQEIVPLNAGNVLVSEDNEPAAKWLVLINKSLNKPHHGDSVVNKGSFKVLSRSLKADGSLHKSCNCSLEYSSTKEKRRTRILSDPPTNSGPLPCYNQARNPGEVFLPSSRFSPPARRYCLVASKQMVGIFLSVWAKKELVPHIGHLRVSTIGRGIMGCFGNKGCISLSMSVYRTSFCFVCCHLASGEKEGDELKRNSDVSEILKSTQFTKNCKNPFRESPERIADHDRVIWLGDLNYRLSLSYEETRTFLENNDWDSLLEKDQLNLERRSGRVFPGFEEGKIMFAPTYKYSRNSDSYAGETVKSKKKRRTPAWCDRILWRGKGFEQLSYIRGESRLSDHRPVCAVFAVNVEVKRRDNWIRKGQCYPPRLAFPDFPNGIV